MTKSKQRREGSATTTIEPQVRPTATPISLPNWAAGAILVALVAVVYFPALNNTFVSDDAWFVQGIAKLSTPAGLADIWFKPGTVPQYNPLAQTVLWVEYQICELQPRLYHAVNIVLHAVVVILLWRLLARLSVPGAWLAAAVFAVHPVQVETVAWLSEIKNLLSAVFALLSLLAYIRFWPLDKPDAPTDPMASPGGHVGYYLLALGLFTCALLAKTATITLPAVILVLIWWKRGRISWPEVACLIPFFAIGISLASVTVWLEGRVIGAVGPEWEFSLVGRILIAGRAVWFYVFKLVCPYPLSFTYPRWQIDPRQEWQYFYPAAALALLGVLWAMRGRIGRGPLAAVLIFGGVLSPTLGYFDVYYFLYSFVADHFQYHACMALIALVAALGVHYASRLPADGYRATVGAAVIVLIVLSAMSHVRVYAFKDNESMLRNNVANHPDAWAGHNNLGDWLRNDNQHEEAREQYREATRLFPQHAPLHNKIGLECLALGRQDEAMAEFEQALKGELDDEQLYIAHFHLFQLLSASNRAAESRSHVEAAIQASVRMTPDDPQVREDAGATFLGLGKLAESEENLRRAIELKPSSASAHEVLGQLLARKGDRDGAAQEFRIALAIDPNNAAATTGLRKLQAGDSPMAQ